MLYALAVAASQVYVLAFAITYEPLFDRTPVTEIHTRAFATLGDCIAFRQEYAVGEGRKVLLGCDSLDLGGVHNVIPH